MSLKLIGIGLAALALLVSGQPVAAYDGFYGVGSYLSTRYSDADKPRIVTKLQQAGARWTRLEMCYTTGTDFIGDTNALNALANTNIRVIGMLNDCDGLPSVDNWGTFVERIVTKFKNQVTAWEIMNEPNGEGMAASSYKEYLQRSHEKIKAITPLSPVLVAGLADANPQFLHELYQAGGKPYFDSVAIHPYKDKPPEEIEFGKDDFLGRLRQIKSTIAANGGGKNIWLTEFGRKSDDFNGEQRQADYQVRAAIIARDMPEVEVVSLYNVRDDGEGTYGLIRSDYTNKMAFERFLDLQNNIEGKGYSGQVLIADQERLTDFTDFGNWDTKESNNASECSAFHEGGREGKGLQVRYSFTAGNAYCAVRNEFAILGAPTAVGFWIDGDNGQNIVRLRIKDATGQTHQLNMGNFPAYGWRYARYDLVNTDAKTHWGGADDGVIHYPIAFESIVLDRDSNRGYHEGMFHVDDIFVLHGSADYWGYRFGNTVAAWRTSGEGDTFVCGQRKRLTERPQYLNMNPNDCATMYSFR